METNAGTGTTVYLAARYGRRAELAAVAHALRVIGFDVVSRWVFGAHESTEDVTSALEDIQDLERAEIVVSFTEGERAPGRARGGRHVEFGFGLARGKRLIVVGPRENVFHHLPGVEAVGSASQLLRLLRHGATKLHASSDLPPFEQTPEMEYFCRAWTREGVE